MGILNNYNLCHIKTIQWDEIITDAPQSRYVYVYNFKEPERDCSPCHESCEVSNSCHAGTALYLQFNFKLFFHQNNCHVTLGGFSRAKALIK